MMIFLASLKGKTVGDGTRKIFIATDDGYLAKYSSFV